MKFRSIMMTIPNMALAEQRKKKEGSCNIIIHGREENKEQSDDALFVNNMTQKVCGNVKPKISRIEQSKYNQKKPIKVLLHNE